MARNAMMERLDAEIEQLEKESFPAEEEKVETTELDEGDEEILDEVEDEVEVPEVNEELFSEVDSEDLEEGSEIEPDEVEKKVKRPSYKAELEKLQVRYNNLRAATDADKFASRTKLANALSEVERLEKENTSLRTQVATSEANTDIYSDIFTEEDMDVLGEDAINVFKKAIKVANDKSIAPLQAQLEAARKQGIEARKGQAQASREEAYNSFLTGLERHVPDYATINVDEGFKKYMDVVPEDSHKSRKDELNEAVAGGNVRWAATFFNEYKALRAAPTNQLAKQVMPKSNSANVVNTKSKAVKTYPIAEYERFMSALTKGKYNTSKAKRELGEQLEAMYDKAWSEGRIL